MTRARSCEFGCAWHQSASLTSSIKVNEKNTIMTPFSITEKITGPYAFSRTNKDTLGDKMELYFHDFSFVPLFIQVSRLSASPD